MLENLARNQQAAMLEPNKWARHSYRFIATEVQPMLLQSSLNARRRWFRPNKILGRLIPPALLSYFFSAWYRCTFDIGPWVGQGNRLAGGCYVLLANVAVPGITVLYLRLLLLPSNQSVPPMRPASWLEHSTDIVECSPEQSSEMPTWETCKRGSCGGRWKPARARHCSDCGVCRIGFDHHCPIFNNCLTTPHIKTFLHLLLWTAPTVLALSLPLYLPLYDKLRKVLAFSQENEALQAYWWDWWGSWVVMGGPIGRWIGGAVLGWRAYPSGAPSLEDPDLGLLGLVGFGAVLVGMTMGLAAMTLRLVLNGSLTVDFERARSQRKLIAKLEQYKPEEAPQSLIDNIQRLSAKTPFWVPVAGREDRKGVVVWTDGENPYDLGKRRNWELVMGKGWDCLKVWTSRFVLVGERTADGSDLDMLKWPLAPGVEAKLRKKAVEVFEGR